MKNLKKLIVAISLSIMLAGTVIADCPIPAPGEVNAPPCIPGTQELIDETSNQATSTATISSEVEVFAFEVVIAGLGTLLTLY
jgi:hypothetical protein